MRYRKSITLAICLLWLISACATTFASELSVSAGSTAVQTGDTVEVSVTVTGKEMAVAEGVFDYDPALLTYKESDGGAADGFINLISAEKNGSSTLMCKIVFEAIGSGEAVVNVSIERILNYDGDQLDGAKGSTTVSVSAAPVEATPTPVPVDYSKTGVKAQNITGAPSEMYIWRSLENVTIPSKYEETETTYHDETVMGAVIKDSNAPELLYLSDAAGENAAYYIYDRASDTLYPYRTISSVLKAYILLQPDSGVQIPAGFTQSSLTVGEKEITAWKSQDAQGDVYLVYGRDPQGEIGFFAYDPEGESVQRYATLPARPVLPELTPSPKNAPVEEAPVEKPAVEDQSNALVHIGEDAVTLQKMVFWGICGFAALMFVLFLVSVISHAIEKKQRRRRAAERRAARDAMKRQGLDG